MRGNSEVSPDSSPNRMGEQAEPSLSDRVTPYTFTRISSFRVRDQELSL
jgi:hypothetical protein